MLMDLRNNGHFLPSRTWLTPRKLLEPDYSSYLYPVLTLNARTNGIKHANPAAQTLFCVPSEDRLVDQTFDMLLDLDVMQACAALSTRYEQLVHVLTCARCGPNAEKGRVHPRTYQPGRLPVSFNDMSLLTFEPRRFSVEPRKLVTVTFGPMLRNHEVYVFIEEQRRSPSGQVGRLPVLNELPAKKQVGFKVDQRPAPISPIRPQHRPLLGPMEMPVRISPPRRPSPIPTAGLPKSPDSPLLTGSPYFPMEDESRNGSDPYFQDSPERPIENHVTNPRGQFFNSQRGELIMQQTQLPLYNTSDNTSVRSHVRNHSGETIQRGDDPETAPVGSPVESGLVFEPDPQDAEFIACGSGEDDLAYF